MKKVLIVIIGILFLTGCASINGQVAGGQNPTHTEVKPITSTPEPSKTQMPTANHTSTKTTNHSTATLSPTPSPTWDGVSMRWISPNGEYIAARYDFGHGEINKPVLEILDYEGNLLQQIVYSKPLPQGDPQTNLNVYGWSVDSKTLYYLYVQGVDGGDMTFWWTGYDLRSINVENGYDQAVIPGEGAMSFAFSPDERKIIYSLASEPAGVIHLLDFESNKNTKIYVDPAPQKFKRIGDFQWSSDGKGIIFQTEEEWLEFEGGGVYMEVQTVYLDAKTLAQKLIHRGAMYDYQLEGWVDDETILVRTYDRGYIWVDIVTGEERPALTGTKTSTPTSTRMPTRTLFPTSTLTPTVSKTAVPTMVVMYMQYDPWLSSVSPNGEFIADVYDMYGHGDIYRPLIEVLNKNRDLLWQIQYKEEIVMGPEPYVSLNFLRWSLNERELYYCTRFHGTRGDYAVWYDGLDPSKIDLYTGKIQPLFPEGSGSTSFEFTDNGGRVVYSFHGKDVDTVYLHNYHTGHTMSVVIDPATQPYQAIGNFHWSPNDEGLVFNTEAEWVEVEGGGIFVEVQTVYLNSLTMEQKLINRSTIYEYELEDWIDNQTFRVHRVNAESRKYEVIAVNVSSGEETILPEATPEW